MFSMAPLSIGLKTNTRGNVCLGVADSQLLAGKTVSLLEIPACAPPKTALVIVTVATVVVVVTC